MKIHEKQSNVLLIAFLICLFATMTSLLYTSPWLLFFLTLPIPVILIYRFENVHEALIISLVSAIVGPFTEVVCVAGGLWKYTDTGGLPYIPFWLFAGWASFSLSLILIAQFCLKKRKLKLVNSTQFWFCVAGLISQVVLFVIFGGSCSDGIMVVFLLIVLQLIILTSRETVVFLLIGIFIGPIVEAVPITAGAWKYPIKDILGMPYYMPFAYGAFAVFVCNISLVAGKCYISKKR